MMTLTQSSNRGGAIFCALILLLAMGTERPANAKDARCTRRVKRISEDLGR
jgi:hypothetical protein